MNSFDLHNIGFILENGEEIWFNAQEDMLEFHLQVGTEHILKLDGQSAVRFKSISGGDMKIAAKANHTYNCFGNPSELTSFQRLMDDVEIAGISISGCDTGVETFYLPEEMGLCCDIDLYGNLFVEIVNYCCCEECELEF